MIKSLLKKNRYLYPKLKLINKITFNLWLINFIFQRLLRRHSRIPFSVHFTSTVNESNIQLHHDETTLASFASSGHCYFQSFNGIELGRNCLFAPGVQIISSNHSTSNLKEAVKAKPIKLGDNIWIGANAVILPEVEIGNNCIIGAGSVVTKSFKEDNLVIAGNPAKIIKKVSK
jgi:acetyltransferase-like isoleucine patch superfamily enzyme